MVAAIKFLKRLFTFLLVLVIVDYALGWSLETAYFSQRKGQFAQTTYSVDSTKQDIIIFGSSRAVRHYSPSIISKALNLSCYNAGRDAQLIPYYAALQEATLRRYKPKMMILDVNSWELAPGEGKYDKLSILLPYCRKHPELLSYVDRGSKSERIKLFSKVYPYNSSLFIMGYNTLFSYKVPADDHGYAPLQGEMTDLMLKDHMERMKSEVGETSAVMDQEALKLYTQFLEKTAKFGIKTYVIISPKILKESPVIRVKKMMEIASRFDNVKFINFSEDPKYNYKYEKFADVFHLNKKGSEEFTKDLISYLK